MDMSWVWPVALAVTMGIFCSTWVRLLQFLVIVFVGTVGSAISMWVGGLNPVSILLNLLIVVMALDGGYFIGLLARAKRTDPPRDKWNAGSDELPGTTAA